MKKEQQEDSGKQQTREEKLHREKKDRNTQEGEGKEIYKKREKERGPAFTFHGAEVSSKAVRWLAWLLAVTLDPCLARGTTVFFPLLDNPFPASYFLETSSSSLLERMRDAFCAHRHIL